MNALLNYPGSKWRVECFDCGHTVDKGNTVRHDAQLAWNGQVFR